MRKPPRSTRAAGLLLGLVALAACAAPEIKTSRVHYQDGAATAGKALVLYGTRAGSTAEVADFVGKKLSASGWSVDVEGVDAARDLGGYQVVVIGTAIRKGRVLPEIRDFVKAHKAELQRIPVAYFAVCMTMREDTPENRAKASAYLDPLRSEVKPVEVGLFAGKVDYAKLDAGSKLIARMVSVPAGDFRDWTAIEGWTEALAGKLVESGR